MNIEIGKNKIYVLVGLGVMLTLVIFYLNQSSVDDRNNIKIDTQTNFKMDSKGTTNDSTQAIKSVNLKIENNTVVASEEIIWKATPEQVAELQNWKASRGWFDTSDENQDDYKTYSKEMLEQLASSGDIKALHLLESRASLVEGKELMIKAAVYGSTRAFSNMISIATIKYQFSEKSSEKESRAVLIDVAVFSSLAKMRGDYADPLESELARLEKKYGIKLEDDDYIVIKEKTFDLYTDLERQREQLGLGKFDNTIPPVVQAHYKALGILK